MDGRVLAVIAVVLVIGAAVQGLVGLGLNLVSAPVVTILDPSLMPEVPLLLATVLPLMTLVRSHAEIDWGGLGWVLSARLPGTAAGVWMLAAFTDKHLGITVAVMVLLAVALTVHAVEVPVRPATLTVAGFLSGVAGTATSIGGPPVALLYQHRSPDQIRSTLAILFTVGAGMSLTGIWVAGHFETRLLVVALLLVPCMAVGTWVGGRLHGVVPDHVIRYAVLGVCGASAIALLVRSLLG